MTSQTARAATQPSPVLLRETLGNIGVLTLNRPDALNALDFAMVDGLVACTAQVATAGAR